MYILSSNFINSCVGYSYFISNQIMKSLSPIQKKATVIAISCLSLIGLSYLTYRYCYRKFTNDNNNNLDPSALAINQAKKVRIDAVDDDSSNPEFDQAKTEIDQLISQGDLNGAWEQYLITACGFNPINNFGPINKGMPQNGVWKFLPTQTLVRELLARCSTSNEIVQLMMPRCLRDCLIAYPDLFDQSLFDCFTGYPEYIADICIKHKQIAKEMIFSSYSKLSFDPDLRLQIFEAAYPLIEKDLDEKKIDIEAMKFLSLFLLAYYHPIHEEMLDKIKKLENIIHELRNEDPDQEEFKQFHLLINLVIAKLNAQGIYNKDKELYHEDYSDTIDEIDTLVLELSDTDTDTELQAHVALTKLRIPLKELSE